MSCSPVYDLNLLRVLMPLVPVRLDASVSFSSNKTFETLIGLTLASFGIIDP